MLGPEDGPLYGVKWAWGALEAHSAFLRHCSQILEASNNKGQGFVFIYLYLAGPKLVLLV